MLLIMRPIFDPIPQMMEIRSVLKTSFSYTVGDLSILFHKRRETVYSKFYTTLCNAIKRLFLWVLLGSP